MKLFTKGFFLTVNIIVVVLFLVACMAPRVSPEQWWPISFITLLFPFLLLILLLFLICWLLFDLKYSLLPLLAIAIGWKSVSSIIAFNIPSSKKQSANPPGSLNVMSYNVAQFGLYREKDSKYTRQTMFALIKKQEPDIVCLQDFYTSERKNDFNNREDISREMKLPYRYFSSDFNRNGMLHLGSIIYSRYPIVKADKIKMSSGPLSESLIYVDIVTKEGDTLRIINMHLESYRFNERDYRSIEKIKKQEDTGLIATRNIVQKMRDAYVGRSKQANIVAAFIKTTPYPVILCGDFNDTPASYTYFTIKGQLQDAFLQKGSGIGRTYGGLAPVLRIDYIFAGKSFKINSFRKINSDLSDHYPIIANLSLR